MTSMLTVLVDHVAPEGEACVRLRLKAASGQDRLVAFEPGAHVDVMTPSGLIRQYSLCSSADDTSAYELCVKQDEKSRGGSLSLCTQVRPGMTLQISHPRNAFPLPKARQYIFVAGGIGITPLLSMILRLQRQDADWQLHYYARKPEQAPFRDMLQTGPYAQRVFFYKSLKDKYPLVLETPHDNAAVMVCGPNGFMASVFSHAVMQGWKTEQIHTEYFRPTEISYAMPDHSFEVVLAQSGLTISVASGQSIASALLAAGVGVPLSCEQGMCGACVVPLLSGEGDHRDMILTEEEQGNHIALCCSRSRSPSLTLDM